MVFDRSGPNDADGFGDDDGGGDADRYEARLRGRAWFVPGRDALRIKDPAVFADSRRAPISGRGTAFSWYRPGELLVRTDAGSDLEEYLRSNKVTPWDPGDGGYWRSAGGRVVDDDQNERLAELAGVRLWTVDIDADLPALIAGARKRGMAAGGELGVNHVAFGEPKYMGGPGGPPTRAGRPKLPEFSRPVGSRTADIAVLDTGLPVDWIGGARYRLQGVISPDDLLGSHEWDVLDADGNSELDRQAAHGLFICGLINRHAPELRIDSTQVLDPDGSGDEFEIITQGLHALTSPVVNLSLGCYTDDNRPPPVLARTIRRLHHSGIVFVAAAGNNGRDPEYRGRRFWPAAMPEVIGVGAYNSLERPPAVADFSNRGRWVDVWAPGVDLVSDYVAGWAVPSPDWADPAEPPTTPVRGTETSTAFVHWSGTSFATPLVAAEIARRVRDNPGDARQVAEDFLDELGFDPAFGRIFETPDYTV